MEAISFPESNIKIAENQPEYVTLPAYWNREEGSVTFCFKLTPEEIERIVSTGEIWFKQLTFNKDMQPIAMSIKKEELLPQTFDINVLDTDTLFDNSPPMGTDECTCSRCGEVINETPIRAWPKEDVDRIGYEYRFHQKCILDELNNIVKNN